MTELLERLAQLTPKQRELVLERLRAQGKLGGTMLPQADALRPLAKDEPVPLSFAQQRLWFIDQYEGPNATYNMRAAVGLSGSLDIAALQRSLDEIVRRHAVLRTVFAVAEGEPVQIVRPSLRPDIAVADLSPLSAEDRAREIQRVLDTEPSRPFDLTAGPLIRFVLLRLAAGEHVLLFVVHHIVCDGWSIAVLVRELTSLYRAFTAGAPSPLPELALQYGDYAAWQRRWLSGERLAQQLDFWKRRLADMPPVLLLPSDRPRPAHASGHGTVERFRVEAELGRRLAQLARRQGASLSMLLLAAYGVLLGRLSGMEDLVIGVMVANRNRPELERLIGFFVNTVPLRLDLAGNPSFLALIERVKQGLLDALSHQDLPFERLVEELKPERNVGHNVIVQVTFNMQNVPTERLDLPGLTMNSYDMARTASLFDLSLNLAEEPGGALGAEWEYTTDLFDAATMQRFGSHFRTLLAAMVDRPDRPIHALPLLDASESHRILVEWNDTATAFPRAATIPDLLTAEAARRPDALALACAADEISYGALERRANRLANWLRRCGVGPDSVVALMDDRSAELILWFVAVLKAGGAYLPIEPSLPPDRVAYLLEDSGASVLLTRAAHARSAACRAIPPRVTVMPVDDIAAEIACEHDTPPAVRIDPANLAYVLYTSGSTGRPKGVGVTHRTVVRLVRDTNYIAPGPTDRVAQVNTVAFDAATFEIWSALLNGGTLDIAERETVLSPALFAAWLRERAITVLLLTTALFNRIAADAPTAFDGIGTVLFGGEAVDPRWVAAVLAAAPPKRLLHIYGPTECTTFSTWHEVRAVAPDAATVPIGTALANTTLYVLDRRFDPMPIGVPGELYVGGDALARGYLGRPDLTAAAFVPDPFDRRGGMRLYRTGDLVRWRADGAIEFIGRTDNQVKIRGFRIEPGETEAALIAHPDLAEAVVVVTADPAGGKRLVGYAVAKPGRPIAVDALRRALRQKLPDYMVPSALMLLDAMPLNANGKIDRKRLPEPEAPFVPVEKLTPTEEVMAGIWATLLGHQRVGAEEDFFELGGHSLLATRAVSRIRDAFAVDLPLRQFFAAATVRESSRLVENLRRGAHAMPPPLVPRPAGTAVTLSFAQERMWVLDQLEGGLAVYNVALALKLVGRFDLAAAGWAFNQILRRHEALRTLVAGQSGTPVAVLMPAEDGTIGCIDLRDLPAPARAARIEALVQAAARHRFDLATGPLIEVKAIATAEDEHLLLVAAHHIVADGWSLGVLAREFAALYTARREGGSPSLPPLSVQYADYASWQRLWLAGEARRLLLDYWTNQLAGAPPVLQLPTDRPRPPVLSFRGGVRPVQIDAALLQGLKELGRQHGATLFMTLFAAFAALLHRYSTQEDLVIGTPVANRTRSEIEPLIGCFVNTLALRVDLAGNPSFLELLGRVRRVALDAYAFQELPFEQLVDALQPERSLSYAPLFQTMFILQNAPFEALALPDLEASAYPVELGTAKYDLTLALEETPDGLAGGLEYATDLFDAATVDRLIGHFRMLLAGIVAEPAAPVSVLPLLTPTDRQRLLVAFNDTAASPPRDLCLHRMVERQIARTPQAKAVVASGEILTYAALNQSANRLARHLVAQGVGPDVPVGICMTRTAEMVVALLAVLKAGGAYVPLDPAYPAERLAIMLEDAQPALILSDRRARSTLPRCDAAIILMDALPDAVTQLDGSDLADRSGAGNLAYILYTSGSTGRPKGVAIEHRSVAILLNWARGVFGSEQLAGVLASTSICFDLSVFELFLPLACGGTVVLAENALELPNLPARDAVTLINTVPSAIAALARVNGIPPSARTICLAGEPLKNALVQLLYDVPTVDAVYNLYGPSEDTTYSTFLRCARGSEREPTIGRPIDETRIYILDRAMAPLPDGVPGELFIGGGGLARGYHGWPDLTAERFVPDPFGAPGARLYRTGDQARWLADGTIAFLGRLDHQVKLRGFRIELGEVEATLARHEAIREAIVLVREDEPGQKRLVAYAAPRTAMLDVEELRRFLAGKLPAYMVPQDIVILPELPHTPNGKIDRRALPQPQTGERGARYVPPRGAKERILAEIWSAVLRIDQPGSDDNFFELGGDSIISLQLVARARQAGLAITPKQVFEHQTIARLAAAAVPVVAVAIEQGPITGEVPLTPVQHWLLEQGLAAPHHFNQAVVIEIEPLSGASLAAIMQHLLAHHDALRARFAWDAGAWRQTIVAPDDMKASELIALRGVSPGDRAAVVKAVAERLHGGFDLAWPPLIRAALFTAAAGEPAWLLLVAHHLVVDGVSWRILLEDFTTLQRQIVSGINLSLPAKTTSYRAWAASLAGAASGTATAEFDYWLRAVAGPALPLPRDHAVPNDMNRAAAAESLRLTFDGESTAALLRDPARAYGMRPDDVLLAALAACLGAWCGAPSVLVDLESHGRDSSFAGIDLSRTVGWFTAIFPVRLAVPGSDPAAALKSVKEQLRAVPQSGVGYGVLRYLHPDQDLRRRFADAPQAEIVFNYLGQFDGVAGDGLRFANLSSGQPIGPANARRHLLEVTAAIAEGKLTVDWTFCRDIHDRATMALLADSFRAALTALIRHCAAPEASGYTPSDFPELDLDQAGLDRLVSTIEAEAAGGE